MPSGTDMTEHSLFKVLSRPVHFETHSWTNSTAEIPLHVLKEDVNATITNALVTLESPYSNLNASQVLTEKLSNFRYFKSDFQFHIKVNSNPFVQGGLIIYWIPMYKQLTTYRKNTTNCYLTGASSMPHVTINLSSSNSATLTVPYAHVQPYIDLTSSDIDDTLSLGRLYVRPLVMLDSPQTSTAVSLTVMGSFVNPEWKVPINDSLSSIRMKHLRRNLVRYKAQDEVTYSRNKQGKVHTSKKRKVVNPHQHNAPKDIPKNTREGEKTGPVTLISGVVANVADALTGVPVIGAVASGVGWISRMVNLVAAYYGWSKPTDLVMASTMANKEGYNMMHSEGKDHSTTIALLQDNSVLTTASTTETDELSFAHIFKQANMINRFSWPGASIAGSKLFAQEVSPVPASMHNNANNSLYVGTLAYTALQAKYWRGTIDYQIEFFKTQYHSGRIIMVYFPHLTANEVPSQYDLSLMTTNYSMIYDLNMPDMDNSDKFSFSIPYMSAQPWKNTYTELGNVPTVGGKYVCNGSFAIYVLNELVHPDTVCDYVRAVVSYSGGDDFEVSVPVKQIIPGFGESTEPVPPQYQSQDEETLVPIVAQQEVKTTTVGEYFTSLRQLLKRFTKVYNVITDKTVSKESTFGSLPHAQDEDGLFKYTMADNTVVQRVNSQLQLFGQMYTFYTGGTRAKLAYGSPSLRGKYGMVLRDGIYEETPDMDKIAHFTQTASVTGISEITIPFYSRFSCKMVCPSSSIGTATGPHSSVGMVVRDASSYGSGASVSELYEACSDDFNYFYMVSPGPVKSATYEVDISTLA